jgi:prolipoprotein diacylglyceryltransferase
MITAWHLICIGFGLAFCLTGQSQAELDPYDDKDVCEFLLDWLVIICILARLMFVAYSHKDFLSSIIIF